MVSSEKMDRWIVGCMFLVSSCIFFFSEGFHFDFASGTVLAFSLFGIILLVRMPVSPFRYLPLVLYFFVLVSGYFPPRIIQTEQVFVPVLLFAFSFCYPCRVAMPVILVCGLWGPVYLSNFYLDTHRYLPSMIPNILAVVCAISLSLERCLLKQHIANNQVLLEKNKILENINRSISSRLFQIEKDSVEEERSRITYGIHNTAGYIFTNIIMMLEAASALMSTNPDRSHKIIDDAASYARKGINEIRFILHDIRDATPERNLQKRFYATGALFEKATGMKVSFEFGNWPPSFSKDLDNFFLSFLQESLTNALKHGQAKHFSFHCWIGEEWISVFASDDGSGCKHPIQYGIGLTDLVAAVKKYQGNIEFPPTEKGFTVSLQIPVSVIVPKIAW